MKSFYETLEVSQSASILVIRAAYRCLAQQEHPDKNPNSDGAGERMLNVNRAYAVLSDSEKREKNDRSQGITQNFRERRNLDSVFPAIRKSCGIGPPTIRPFAFRPLC